MDINVIIFVATQDDSKIAYASEVTLNREIDPRLPALFSTGRLRRGIRFVPSEYSPDQGIDTSSNNLDSRWQAVLDDGVVMSLKVHGSLD